jgi:hypothetical protein
MTYFGRVAPNAHKNRCIQQQICARMCRNDNARIASRFDMYGFAEPRLRKPLTRDVRGDDPLLLVTIGGTDAFLANTSINRYKD